ncbi:S24 family peptidase [Parvibaculum sp.]|uniref:XRE family transcriptional regulator n=1 Tax=Parvibaculum sp. TaxID=2024848 RepID=UPI001DB5FB4B|nr:S24 family peptidase [Parvibaculum sp.]MBX3488899.1 XRE family transcriptional regulator [Parvibaculum sp.]MCW5727219.1 XRE family transcriptional regulator [Parvibaculum sp.]
MEIHERLQQARRKAGFETAAAAAAAIGVNPVTYWQHESGLRGVSRKNAERYAAFFRVDLTWLATGRGRPARKDSIPVVGYVGAGAEVHPVDDHALGDGFDRIEASALPADAVALIVRGDSMYPIEDGWVIIYRRDRDGVPSACLNRLCVVKVANDGPTLIKKIRRGSEKNTYTLESWNAPPRENQVLDWAAPVEDLKPR